ncbi:MAG: DNA primase [Oscillospiraceae bacterium]|nr:DNA primase [Oscillospiraceae bacterium]
MARLPEEFILRLREQTDIVELFRTYADVKKRGRTYVCCCPFHSEKTPSCHIWTDDPHFYCFGCGAGGDVITFVRKMDNLSYIEAVRYLAERCGLEMPRQDPEAERGAYLRRRCYEINRETARFYYSYLLKGPDQRGLRYFSERRLTPATVQKYGLGYAPDDWNQLRDHLRRLGYHDEEMVTAGVCRKSDKGSIYDYFRGRVIFPIIDQKGSVIAFGGRVLDGGEPKYLNTNDTPVYSKRKNLFSLNFAKNASSNTFILCEGYMDVIAMNQAGFENAVATLGTAITPEQARLISNYARDVVLAYDSDGAGQKATQRAINYFGEVGIPTRILRMEGAKDPDEFIKKFGPERFRMLIDNAGDALVFRLDKCKDGLDPDTEAGRTELLRRSVRILAELQNPLEQEVYAGRVAEATGVQKDTILIQVRGFAKRRQEFANQAEFREIEAKAVRRDAVNPEAQQHPRESRAEERIIAYLLRFPSEIEQVREAIPPELFVTEFHRRVYAAICQADWQEFSLSLLADQFSVDEMSRITGISAQNAEVSLSRDDIQEFAVLLRKAQDSPVTGSELTDDDLLRAVQNRKHNGQ